ncbi:MAG: hypothetical protein AMXMBFR58_27180 [Phycisphaerae bacterium]|nr:hypothetical protein [Phycisphaerales bacterium]MCK6477690.1 N-acetylmuramoyl-L-alanine amidase [Phycisphaerales bacterium]
MASRKSSRTVSRPPQAVSRTQVVWGLLVMAMTGVGGVLWLADRSSGAPRLDGLALASLVSTDQPPSVEAVFRTRRPIEHGRWKSIVIHHSATPSGTPETLAARGPDPSTFHFIIGNGNGMDDGGLYVDHRWLLQEATRHAHGSDAAWYDQNAVSICLVGDGERGEFSREQVDRLVDLVQALARRLGVRSESIVLASDVSSRRSPGRFFPGAEFHERISALVR